MLVYSKKESEGMSGFQTLNARQCTTRVNMSYVDMMFSVAQFELPTARLVVSPDM